MENKMAIIDLGSNSVRMIIMKVNGDNSYKMIDQAREIVRLSEGMGKDKTLKSSAMDRTLVTLKIFRKLIEVHQVQEVFAIATAAVRNASNRQDFLEKIESEIGLKFSVVTGDEEGYYDYLGVINTIDIRDCVIIDIGGASTELVLVENRKLKSVVSMPYGAVILTEMFCLQEGGSCAVLDKFIQDIFKNIEWLKEARNLPVVGLGGSIRTLAKVHKKKNMFPLEVLHNYQMSFEDMEGICNQIARTPVEERSSIPGIAKNRADIIVGGIVPVWVLMRMLGSDKLIISGNGLREGVFYQKYIQAYGDKNELLQVLPHSLENTLKKYDVNIQHSRHVQKISLSLFDQLRSLHEMGEDERKILSAGALLHDIGMYVDYYNHHKHGFYLVMNSGLNGLTHRELTMCGFIVGMHRITEFKQDWKQFDGIIDKNDYDTVKKLSLLVRIAEKLDRSEYGSVQNIACHIKDDAIHMVLETKKSADLEVATAMKNNKIFEKLFGKKLLIY